MTLVDLEKPFDRVPRDVIWWALRELGVEEHVVLVIQTMYSKRVQLSNKVQEKVESLRSEWEFARVRF